MKNYLFIALMALCSFSSAQKEANMWYFGDAALDFNPGAPVVLTNSAMSQWEGVSSIADSNGVLLFYTDGISVWNATHTIMPNGTGLFGNYSSTQSALITRKPGSVNLYYIFTTDVLNGNGFNYSIVDMSLNGGLGDVTIKNFNLFPTSTEKLTGVLHANRYDAWIVTHDYGNNNFQSFELTSSGLNTVPVTSSVGPMVSGMYDETGYLKISPDGTKLAMVIEGSNQFWLCDFNTANGTVSNPMLIYSSGDYAYGVEFSPNGKVLYGNCMDATAMIHYLFQWDLSSGNAATINASRINLNPNIMGASYLAGISIAPDQKIYFTREPCFYLGAINNPNTVGLGCNLVDSAIYLSGRECHLGLPNLIVSLYYMGFNYTNVCLGDSTLFNISDTAGLLSVHWNFGDAPSGINNSSTLFYPSHLFSSAGTFQVELIRNYSLYTDTVYSNLTIQASPVINLGADTTFCNGGTYMLHAGSGFTNYQWQNGSTDSTFTVSTSGNYWVTVSSGSCISTDTIQLNAIPCNLPVISFQATDNAFCSNTCIGFSDLSTNNPSSWSWNFPGGTPATSTLQNPAGICYFSSGIYNVTLIACNASGCDTLDLSNFITVFPPLNFAPIVQSGDTLFSVPGFAGYQWFEGNNPINGATGYFYVAPHSGTYSVQVTDSNGCNATATKAGVIASMSDLLAETGNMNAFYSGEKIHLSFQSSKYGRLSIQLIDVPGRILYTQNIITEHGMNEMDISIGPVANGIYFIRIQSEKSFLKQKILVENR
jgi:hypothetical protein